MFGLYDLEFLLEKSLSVKVPINKEDFEIVDGFLVGWEFDFWVVKWLKCLILVGFDDMGYDKGFEGVEFGILLDFCGIFKDIDKVKFWRKSVDKSAIGSAVFPGYLFSFWHPPHHRTTVFSYFSVGTCVRILKTG